MGAQHCPLGLHALWGLRAAGVVGGRPRGGWPATVVRGVWCQALSLPQSPALWGRQPGFRDPCTPGAVAAGVGTRYRPHTCALAGRRCAPWGWRKGFPGGGVPFAAMRGVSGQALPPLPDVRPPGGLSGSTPTCCGHGCAGVGAQHCPLGLHALWGLRAAGVVGGRPRGGWPATVVRGVWCQELSLSRPPVLLGGRWDSVTRVSPVRSVRAWGPSTGPTTCALANRRCSLCGWRKGVPGGGAFCRCEGCLRSGAPPPPTARPLGRAVGVPRPVCPGCGRCGRGDEAPVPQRVPLRACVARCGCGEMASLGGRCLSPL